MLEFALVFKALYDDKRQEDDLENQKSDLCTCIQVLLANSESAKRAAVDQNLAKKAIKIC